MSTHSRLLFIVILTAIAGSVAAQIPDITEPFSSSLNTDIIHVDSTDPFALVPATGGTSAKTVGVSHIDASGVTISSAYLGYGFTRAGVSRGTQVDLRYLG